MSSYIGLDQPLLHGGDLAAARRCFPARREPFIDLSTGINPIPIRCRDLPAELFARLPEPAAVAALAADRRARLWRAVGRRMWCRRRARKSCCRWSPRWCRRAAPPCWRRPMPSTRARRGAGRAPVDRGRDYRRPPATPTSSSSSIRTIRTAGSSARTRCSRSPTRCAARGGLLVVDEAFMDVGPAGASLAAAGRARQHRGAALVRQILRAGRHCGSASRSPRRRWRRGLPPRSVRGRCPGRRSPPARRRWPMAPGSSDARAGWRKAAERLDGILTAAGLTSLGGTSLFRLVAWREQTNCFIISAAPALWCACSRNILIGSASGCRPASMHGGGCTMPWRRSGAGARLRADSGVTSHGGSRLCRGRCGGGRPRGGAHACSRRARSPGAGSGGTRRRTHLVTQQRGDPRRPVLQKGQPSAAAVSARRASPLCLLRQPVCRIAASANWWWPEAPKKLDGCASIWRTRRRPAFATWNGWSRIRRKSLQPDLACHAAPYLSPWSGIVDSHGLMLAYRAELEAHRRSGRVPLTRDRRGHNAGRHRDKSRWRPSPALAARRW